MKLSDLTSEIRETHDPKKDSKEYLYIGLEHILPHSLRINSYSDSNSTESLKYKFKKNDIVFGTMRPYFKKIAKTPYNGVCSTEFSVIRSKQKSDCNYIFYLLAQDVFIKYCNVNSKGDRPRVKWKQFSKFEVNHKNKRERFLIGNILSVYDLFIEINSRRIRLLEEAARLLYREWFVYFRFPGHENVKIVDGIPEGWEKKSLSKIVTTQYGYTETATQDKIGPKFLRGKDINKSSYIDWNSVPYCSDKKLDFNKYCLSPGDILIIRMADPGKVGIVEKEIKAIFASYLVRLKIIDKNIPPYFLFYSLVSNRYQGYINGASAGSTRKSASAKLMVSYDLLIPKKEIINSFNEQIIQLRRSINILIEQNQKLAQARDLLLPRLMSGKIDVSEFDAENMAVESEVEKS